MMLRTATFVDAAKKNGMEPEAMHSDNGVSLAKSYLLTQFQHLVMQEHSGTSRDR